MSVFITLEGIEGSGKSTQAKLLEKFLLIEGYDVCLTREPGGTDISDSIRSILLDPENKNMNPTCELLLYAAARAQHVNEVILPSLSKNKIVICDRFVDATLAYQGYARGLDFHLIDQLNQLACGPLKPDLTLLIDIDVGVGVTRARDRNKSGSQKNSEARFDNEAYSFHQKVRDGYLKIARENSQRVHVIDGSADVTSLSEKINQIVRSFLKK